MDDKQKHILRTMEELDTPLNEIKRKTLDNAIGLLMDYLGLINEQKEAESDDANAVTPITSFSLSFDEEIGVYLVFEEGIVKDEGKHIGYALPEEGYPKKFMAKGELVQLPEGMFFPGMEVTDCNAGTLRRVIRKVSKGKLFFKGSYGGGSDLDKYVPVSADKLLRNIEIMELV